MNGSLGGGPGIVDVSPHEAARLLAGDQSLPIVDVRQRGEFKSGHISGASCHPLLGGVSGMDGFDRSAPILVVCASGHRSMVAARLLRRRGFQHILSLVGGTAAWARQGLPLE